MRRELLVRLMDASVTAIEDGSELLAELDRALGDGDHGASMERGFLAIRREREAIAALPLTEALQKVGTILVTNVGGASGPLYGRFFEAMGRIAGSGPPESVPLVEAMVTAGVAAVKRLGQSDAGDKTMLDVLVAVQEAIHAGVSGAAPSSQVLSQVKLAASTGLAATALLQARRGRAAVLGERSVGRLDPGAQSACLLVHAVCDTLADEARS